MSESTAQDYRKRLVKAFIMVAIILVISALPTFGDVTKTGMVAIGIFVATVYGWIFVDLALASIISITALCLSGGLTANEVFAGGLGNFLVAMSLVFLFIATAIQQLKIGDVIIDWMMGLSISRGRPWIKFALFIFAIFFVSVLTSSQVACVMSIPLFYSFIEKSDIPTKSPLCHALFGALAFAVFIGDVAFPFKAAPLMYFGIISSAGIEFNPGSYIFAFPFVCFLLICYVLTCRFVFRIDVSPLKKLDQNAEEKKVSLSKTQKLFSLIVAALLIVMCVMNFVPTSWGIIYTIVNRLGFGGLAFLFLAILVLVQVDGKSLIDFPTLAKDFPWPVFFMMVNFLPLANFLVADSVGLKTTLANTFGPILGNMSTMAMSVVVICLAALLTNFLNNQVVFMIFISAICLLADTIPGLNAVALSYLVGIAATLCYALPSGNMMMAYLFNFTDIIDRKKWILMNAISILILCIICATLGYFYYSLVF